MKFSQSIPGLFDQIIRGSKSMPSVGGDQQIDEDLKTTSTWLLVAFFLGWCALFLRLGMQGIVVYTGLSSYRNSGYSTLAYQTATAFIWTLAWLTGGFLFGFIFGIPKVIAATASTGNPGANDPTIISSPKLKVNTNLEDISDWLTKVLVGATLTQIVKIPDAIGAAAEYMSKGTGPDSLSFNAALLVYYSALGFLSGYILTRMFFARAFALADQGPGLSSEAAKSLDDANVGFGQTTSLTNNPSLRKAAIASDSVPITDSLSGDQALRLAKGATLTGDVTRALTASKLAVQKNPDDPQAQITYAWSLHKLGAGLETVLPLVEATARKIPVGSDPSVVSSVYNSLAYLWLYQPPPGNFESALCVLDEYDAKGGAPDSSIEINRACAFGQQYLYLRHTSSDREASEEVKTDLAKARQGAFDAVKKALALDPSTITRLKELLWVTADPRDNDLSGFQDDAEFTTLLPRN